MNNNKSLKKEKSQEMNRGKDRIKTREMNEKSSQKIKGKKMTMIK